jgi:hypothetical protein
MMVGEIMRLSIMGFLILVNEEILVSKEGFMTESWMLVGMILMLVGNLSANWENVSLES